MTLLSMILAVVAVVVGSFVLPVLLMLLLPGRKGSMRTRREAVHSGTTAEVFEGYAARLAYDGFAVDASGFPAVLRARRGKLFEHPDGIPTHATKPTTIEVRFSEPPARHGEVTAMAEAWLNDFVLWDTGEGRQLDETLHRLLAGDLAQDPPPAVATPSFHAVVACSAAAISCAGAWLLPRMIADDGRATAAAAGLIVGTLIVAFPESRAALRDIAMRPGEVTGAALAKLAPAIAKLAPAIAVVGIALNVLLILRLAGDR